MATDVAFTLPFDSSRHHFPADGPSRVGLNVSGLLWAGGYTGDNQFNLTVDYREYCRRVVDLLVTAGHEVHLVPHVLARPGESDEEDDVRAALELQAEHPECLLAPAFTSPVDAKSWIHHLDVLIGSRMHATIAALTAGVPTIPAAYSRKFAGFFGNLGYPVLVDLTRATTDDAVSATLAHVADRERLHQLTNHANTVAQRRIEVFREYLVPILNSTIH